MFSDPILRPWLPLFTPSPPLPTRARPLGSPDWTDWQTASSAELANMGKYGTWTPAPREPTMRTLQGSGSLRKLDSTTNPPSAYKPRFVVQGYKQIEGVGYTELIAPVAHKDYS